MRRLFRVALPITLGVFALSGYIPPQDRKYIDYFLKLEAAELFRTRSFLLTSSWAYVSAKKLEKVDMRFSFYRAMDINEARRLIVFVAQELIDRINSDSTLKQRHLVVDSFPIDDLRLEIRMDNVLSANVDPPQIKRVVLDRGVITYDTFKGSTLFYATSDAYKETFQYALMLLDEPTTSPIQAERHVKDVDATKILQVDASSSLSSNKTPSPERKIYNPEGETLLEPSDTSHLQQKIAPLQIEKMNQTLLSDTEALKKAQKSRADLMGNAADSLETLFPGLITADQPLNTSKISLYKTENLGAANTPSGDSNWTDSQSVLNSAISDASSVTTHWIDSDAIVAENCINDGSTDLAWNDSSSVLGYSEPSSVSRSTVQHWADSEGVIDGSARSKALSDSTWSDSASILAYAETSDVAGNRVEQWADSEGVIDGAPRYEMASDSTWSDSASILASFETSDVPRSSLEQWTDSEGVIDGASRYEMASDSAWSDSVSLLGSVSTSDVSSVKTDWSDRNIELKNSELQDFSAPLHWTDTQSVVSNERVAAFPEDLQWTDSVGSFKDTVAHDFPTAVDWTDRDVHLGSQNLLGSSTVIASDSNDMPLLQLNQELDSSSSKESLGDENWLQNTSKVTKEDRRLLDSGYFNVQLGGQKEIPTKRLPISEQNSVLIADMPMAPVLHSNVLERQAFPSSQGAKKMSTVWDDKSRNVASLDRATGDDVHRLTVSDVNNLASSPRGYARGSQLYIIASDRLEDQLPQNTKSYRPSQDVQDAVRRFAVKTKSLSQPVSPSVEAQIAETFPMDDESGIDPLDKDMEAGDCLIDTTPENVVDIDPKDLLDLEPQESDTSITDVREVDAAIAENDISLESAVVDQTPVEPEKKSWFSRLFTFSSEAPEKISSETSSSHLEPVEERSSEKEGYLLDGEQATPKELMEECVSTDIDGSVRLPVEADPKGLVSEDESPVGKPLEKEKFFEETVVETANPYEVLAVEQDPVSQPVSSHNEEASFWNSLISVFKKSPDSGQNVANVEEVEPNFDEQPLQQEEEFQEEESFEEPVVETANPYEVLAIEQDPVSKPVSSHNEKSSFWNSFVSVFKKSPDSVQNVANVEEVDPNFDEQPLQQEEEFQEKESFEAPVVEISSPYEVVAVEQDPVSKPVSSHNEESSFWNSFVSVFKKSRDSGQNVANVEEVDSNFDEQPLQQEEEFQEEESFEEPLVETAIPDEVDVEEVVLVEQEPVSESVSSQKEESSFWKKLSSIFKKSPKQVEESSLPEIAEQEIPVESTESIVTEDVTAPSSWSQSLFGWFINPSPDETVAVISDDHEEAPQKEELQKEEPVLPSGEEESSLIHWKSLFH